MKRILSIALALAFVLGASAQKTLSIEGADEVVRLWDNTTAKYSNHETRDEEWYGKNRAAMRYTSSCDLYIFKADPTKALGAAVVIFPGGGYRSVTVLTTLSKWYASQGITAALVKYRMPNGHKEATFEDAVGAIQYLRTRTDLGVNPAKVGISGASAGGHLAAWVSNAMPDGQKPAFAILEFPAISRTGFNATEATNRVLMGKDYCYQDAIEMSAENMVSPTTPPTLLMLCDDDTVVMPVNSVIYYEKLIRYGVKASIHIYPEGGHSMNKHLEEYRGYIIDWLKYINIIE
jgi:acetyl esterase/lipase